MSLFAGQAALSAPEAPLVSSDDFAEWYSLGNGTAASLTTLEQNRIQTALEIASAQIRNGRRLFSPVTDEIITVDSDGGSTLLLSKTRLPVTAVSLVEALNGDAYDTVDATEYDWSADGYLTRAWLSGWPCRAQGVRVTYSHGYAVLPREVAGVCLSLAKRLYDNPSGQALSSMTLGDYSATYESGSAGLLPNEVDVLALYEAIA